MSKRKKKALLKLPKLSKGGKIALLTGAGVLIAVLVFSRPKIAPGYFTKSFLGSAIQTRGLRNNNPGNILLTSEAWEGKLPREQNTDGKFEQFKTYAYGVRAMIVLLNTYFSRYKLNTLEQIVYKWNPGNPNYVTFVAATLGIPKDQKLTASKDTIKKLVTAIADFENGITSNQEPAITDGDFEAAWSIV